MARAKDREASPDLAHPRRARTESPLEVDGLASAAQPTAGTPTPRPGTRASVAPPSTRRGGRASHARALSEPPRSTRSARAKAKAAPRTPTLSPEEHLARAMQAETPRSRGLWARRGLAARARIDRTTQAMLLRQLYLAHFEQRHFREAFEITAQSLELGVLTDVLHQDAARAAAALGDLVNAARHLRTAARIGPAHRRAFHWWTLGSMFFLSGRYDEAIGALERAARWGTRDKPLYQGHLAVARAAAGEDVEDLPGVIQRLAGVPSGQGYGRFVLGLLSFYRGRTRDARRYLESFVQRTEVGRPASTIALAGELALARRTLLQIDRAKSS